ncbi:MAG: SPFH domain-containing protein [Saccharofermentans sp.]|nr:SPFH domain-containing protein [Saccharofermentans sp.]
MGIIKLTNNILGSMNEAVSSEVKDQYLEAFRCDSLGQVYLLRKGARLDKTHNNKGNEDVISSGSKVIVAEGQYGLFIDNGKVSDVMTEAGLHVVETDSSPSVFGGGKAKGIIGNAWERFTFAGETPTKQAIYFVNALEIMNLPEGQYSVTYRDPDYRNVYVKGRIVFSIRVVDPVVFYKSVTGQVSGDYKVEDLVGTDSNPGMLIDEACDLTEEAIAKLSDEKIPFAELMGERSILCRKIKNEINKDWKEKRGIEIVHLTLNINASGGSMDRMAQFDQAKIFSDDLPALAAAQVLGQTEAQKIAAGNPAGAVTGVAGLAMMNAVCPCCNYKPENGVLGMFCDACGAKLKD